MNKPTFDFSTLDRPTRKKLARLAQARLDQIDAENDRAAAEANYEREQGAKVEHAAELARCAADPIYWFNTWVWTYNPKLVGRKNPDGSRVSPFLRFKLWPRQVEFIHWLQARMANEEQGLCEKSRDAGISYLCVGFALHQWLFNPGFSATFGSRIKDYVDQKDNPDALFPKMRIMLDRLPKWMLPEGFDRRKHDTFAKLVNPANEAIITGEGGKNMGRGGRSTMYVLDEAAHVPNADEVEAALSGNTDCVIWVSSVNGSGNLFYRKRFGGGEGVGLDPRQIFTFHYRDDPRKDAAWVAKKKREVSAVNWAQEYEIDYSASLEGVCIPGRWVQAAQKLADLVTVRPSEISSAGLDVGAGGKGKSIFIPRYGHVCGRPKARREADTTGTAVWGLDNAVACNSRHLNYDAPGVGVGVTSTFKSVKRPGVAVHPINTGADPFVVTGKWEDGRTSKEQFFNLKMELWWIARTRFQKAYELWLFLTGAEDEYGEQEGRNWPLEEVIILPRGDPDSDTLAAQLSMVKMNAREDGRLIMEKKTELAKRGVASPDYADAFVLTFVVRRTGYDIAALG